MVSGFTLEKLGLHIGLLLGNRLDTILLRRLIRRPRVIRFFADLFFFHSRERIKNYPDPLPNSPDACERKTYQIRVDRA